MLGEIPKSEDRGEGSGGEQEITYPFIDGNHPAVKKMIELDLVIGRSPNTLIPAKTAGPQPQ